MKQLVRGGSCFGLFRYFVSFVGRSSSGLDWIDQPKWMASSSPWVHSRRGRSMRVNDLPLFSGGLSMSKAFARLHSRKKENQTKTHDKTQKCTVARYHVRKLHLSEIWTGCNLDREIDVFMDGRVFGIIYESSPEQGDRKKMVPISWENQMMAAAAQRIATTANGDGFNQSRMTWPLCKWQTRDESTSPWTWIDGVLMVLLSARCRRTSKTRKESKEPTATTGFLIQIMKH